MNLSAARARAPRPAPHNGLIAKTNLSAKSNQLPISSVDYSAFNSEDFPDELNLSNDILSVSAPGCHEDRRDVSGWRFMRDVRSATLIRYGARGNHEPAATPEPGAGVGAAGDEQCNRVDHKREAGVPR